MTTATTAESAEWASAHADGTLRITKATTQIKLSDLVWGTYKNEGGTPYGSYFMTLVRQHDGKALGLPVEITVNGAYDNTVSTSPGQVVVHQLTFPPKPSPWSVEATFHGNASYAASSATKTYVKPN